MSDALAVAVPWAAGVGLGAFFFGGLWWTVRWGLVSRRAPLWFAASLLVRTAVVLAGFYAVSAGRWERLLACLFGFVVARGAASCHLRASAGPE